MTETGGNAHRTRRPRVTVVGAACLALGSAMVACGDGGDGAIGPVVRAERSAGTWKTWVLSSGSEIQVPPPPAKGSAQAKADLDAVKDRADKRTAATSQVVEKWSGPLAMKPWTETAFDFVSKSEKNPPLSSRNYALVHVAMYDSLVASYHWKYQYNVEGPRGVKTLVPSSPDPS